jgi:hypothetical protein
MIDAFVFFDKDGDGKMRRKDVTRRMNETSHQERTPGHITARLFSNSLYIYLSIYYISLSLSLARLKPVETCVYVCRGNGPGPEWEGEPEEVPVLHDPMGWSRD